MTAKKQKPKPTKTTETMVLENKIDAMNELFMTTINKINELEKQVQNLSTNFTFHTHDTMLRTGPATFNQAMYNTWMNEQKAKEDAAKAEAEKTG